MYYYVTVLTAKEWKTKMETRIRIKKEGVAIHFNTSIPASMAPSRHTNKDIKIIESNIKKKSRVRMTVQFYPFRDDQTALDRL